MSEILNSAIPPIIVALDYSSSAEAWALVEKLDPKRCRLKVGKELFTRAGPDFVKALVAQGYDIFLDLKFHDIPNTTAKAVAAAADLGVWMVNVHASGGAKMMEAAAQQLEGMASPTLLVGVTVLTSMGEEDLAGIGVTNSIDAQVLRLAHLANASGLQGVVCSAHEAATLQTSIGDHFLRVTPGIRPANSATNDQTRIMTPSQAMANGSSHLVIGRPVTAASDPLSVLVEINDEISLYC